MPPWDKYAAVTPQAAPAGPWAKYAAPASEVAPQDQATAGLSSVAGGILQNFGDEAKAYIQSKFPELTTAANTKLFEAPSWMPDFLKASPQGPAPVGTYEQELERNRAQNRANEEAYPITTTAGNIGGQVAGAVSLMRAAPAAVTTMGPSLTANAVKLGGAGAVLGGVSGYGAGEGGSEARTANAVIPAAAGLVLGGATPFVGALASKAAASAPGRFISGNVVDPLVRALKGGGQVADDVAPSVVQNAAVRQLTTAAQRGQFNPVEGQAALDRLGPAATAADINPALRGQAELAVTMPGQTLTRAEQTIGTESPRYLQAPQRMTTALEGGAPPPSAFQLRGEGQAFAENVKAVGRDAYQGRMAGAGLNETPQLKQLYQNPEVKGAMDRVNASIQSAMQGRPNAVPPSEVEIMHMVKREIQGLGLDKMTGKPLSTANVWQDTANDFVRTLKAANPELAAADVAYAQAKSLPEFFDRGASALGRSSAATEAGIDRSAPAIAEMVQGATPQQVAAGRAGIINQARMQAQEGTPETISLAKRLQSSQPLQEKFSTLSSPEHAADIVRQARAETTFEKTRRSVMEGSPTARRMAQMAEEEGAPNIHLRADPRGLLARAYDSTADFLRRVQAPNEAVRDEIGRLLLNPDAPQNRELMLRLAAALQARQTAGYVPAGVAATGGTQINRMLQ